VTRTEPADVHLLITREQAAELCQCSLPVLDEWSWLPGFPVIRRNGGHFVRIHRAALVEWLARFATSTNPPLNPPPPPPSSAVKKKTPAPSCTRVGVSSIGQPGGRSRAV
jgi:hypothetical protein